MLQKELWRSWGKLRYKDIQMHHLVPTDPVSSPPVLQEMTVRSKMLQRIPNFSF